MATIVYLDPEDEITSAASRIRQAPETRVALVVPFGSRVATSRINFRLLAREAMRDGKRMDIVAPDASARALAASAGIPVFASVGEYEAAIARPEPDLRPGPGAAGAAGVALGATAAGLDAAGLAGTGAGTAADDLADIPVPRSAGRGQLPAGAVGGFASATASPVATDAARQAELDAVVQRSREAPRAPRETPPVRKPRRRVPGALLAGLLVLVVALGVATWAALAFLPAATVTVTPHIEPVGPVTLTVTANPDAVGVDAGTLTIPAQVVEIPVEATGEFKTTGKRVEKTAATGGVRWTNCDPTASYTIPKGSQVRTSGGTAFAIDETVFLPVAIISGGGSTPQLKCQSSEVAITAVKKGTGGNVPAGTIRVVPSRYNRNVVRVTNPGATSGGTETSYPRVSQKDVDAATASLQKELETTFASEVANPNRVPPGFTAYPETARLGDATPNPAPDTLVGTDAESFTLTLSATGQMLTVDTSQITSLAEAQLQDQVAKGATLVDGSTKVSVGEGTVNDDGTITFPATVTAQQAFAVDKAAIRTKVLGMSEAGMAADLHEHADVMVTFWPFWVDRVPTLEQRVTVVVKDPVTVDGTPGGGTAAPSLAPQRSDAPSDDAGASADPSGDGSVDEPLPSG